MPEGPSIIILKEQAQAFAGKKILSVSGNTKLDVADLAGKKVLEFRSWGKVHPASQIGARQCCAANAGCGLFK